MGRLQDTVVEFLSRKEIDGLVAKLAKSIEQDYKNKELVLVCPLKGSFVFLADLTRQINLPQQIDFVQLVATEKHGAVRMAKDISVNIHGKHVLIVEEIIDAGRSLSFLKTRLLAAGPASLRIACLLDKPARRELPIKPDYIGKTVDDRYLVGYGMDSEEVGRNYAGIYSFKQ